LIVADYHRAIARAHSARRSHQDIGHKPVQPANRNA
jgi:hypothetical protein